MSNSNVNRRDFLKSSAVVSAGAAASIIVGPAAKKVLGANDRLNIGVIGASARARQALMPQVFRLSDKLNAEIVAVCDLWSVNREKGVKMCTDRYGRKPKEFKYMDEMLKMSDLDGIIIGTGDFQHALLLEQLVKAGKDCYCEKPMAITLDHAKRAYNAVKNSKQIVQIGTQVLSSPTSYSARKAVQSGVLGKISKIDMFASYWGPRWRGREETKMIREQDTDWKAWILDRPYRPFDPVLYFEYRIYKDFAAGIAGQWMSHNIAEVAMIMGETMPRCVYTMGGNYLWKDGREVSDTYHCLIKYPSEFNVSYSCNFGNNFGDYLRFYGLNGTMEKVSGGMESGRYVISGIGGGGEPTPENEEKARKQAGSGMEFRVNKNRIREKQDVQGEGGTPGEDGHMQNFLECMRSRMEPGAPILSGYAHSVICIMAHQSDLSGKPLYWDAKREEIVDAPPKG